MENKLGLVAKLTKQQKNRGHFSDIPVGTKFIILEEHGDMPAYDLTGYFLNYPPMSLAGKNYYTGYIDKGSWEIVGDVKSILNELSSI